MISNILRRIFDLILGYLMRELLKQNLWAHLKISFIIKEVGKKGNIL